LHLEKYETSSHVTPVDFQRADLLSKWARKIDVAAGWGGNVRECPHQLFLALIRFAWHQTYMDLLLGSRISASRQFSCA